MIVERVSKLTGVKHFREIKKVTQAEINDWQQSGVHIQNYFPDLSANDRKFILTGITPEEWDLYMGEPEEDDIVPPWVEDGYDIVVDDE